MKTDEDGYVTLEVRSGPRVRGTKVNAQIKDTATGEVHETSHDYPHDDLDAIRFHWSEGNYSCDCNRELFYLRAAGELGENELIDSECTEGRYHVQVRADGATLLDEFNP